MYESTLPACTLLRAHSSRRTSSDPRPSHVLCGLMKAASHGAVHDAGQPHVDRTGCHARRPLGGITGAGRCGGSSAAGFRWPSLAFRSQIYYFRSSVKHHTQQLAAAAQVGDAKGIRRKITQMKIRLMKDVLKAGGRA